MQADQSAEYAFLFRQLLPKAPVVVPLKILRNHNSFSDDNTICSKEFADLPFLKDLKNS